MVVLGWHGIKPTKKKNNFNKTKTRALVLILNKMIKKVMNRVIPSKIIRMKMILIVKVVVENRI